MFSFLNQNSVGRLAAALLSTSLLFATADVSAASLSCVQRAINWNNASRYNYVTFSVVALHESEVASYASGHLSNSNCTRAPYADGTVTCLVTSGSVKALLSNRSYYNSPVNQPFDAKKPLLLAVDVIPSDNLAQVHLHQQNATYDFDPRCVGNLLTGDDQWGNHWTIAFGLGSNPPPR